MIETSLVYIHAKKPTSRFVGCGALVEGGYVATCRHVWVMATEEKPLPGETLEVEIEYPHSHKDGAPVRTRGQLADACEGAPDLVLLQPDHIPTGVMALQLAAAERFEVGSGYTYARIARSDERNNREIWRDAFSEGEIASAIMVDGLRQFTGKNMVSYWFTPGSSGSPVFLNGGQQLAGILSLSELGENAAKSPLHVAFLVPATTIGTFVKRAKESNPHAVPSQQIGNDLASHKLKFITEIRSAVDAMSNVTFHAIERTLTRERLVEYERVIALYRADARSEQISISLRDSRLGEVASKFLYEIVDLADKIDQAIDKDKRSKSQNHRNLRQIYVDVPGMTKPLITAFA